MTRTYRRTARRKPTTLPLGTISEATLRPEHLIPAYLGALDGIRLSQVERATIRQINRRWVMLKCLVLTEEQIDEVSEMLDDLTAILESHTPDYAYFGTLEGDGACFGVWPNIEQAREECKTINAGDCRHERSYRINTSSRRCFDCGFQFNPADWRGPILEVTDHGNVTLYRREGNRWVEVEVTDHGNVTLYRRAGNRWVEVWSVV